MFQNIDFKKDALDFVKHLQGKKHNSARSFTNIKLKSSEKILCKFIEALFANKNLKTAFKEDFADEYSDAVYDETGSNIFADHVEIIRYADAFLS